MNTIEYNLLKVVKSYYLTILYLIILLWRAYNDMFLDIEHSGCFMCPFAI